MSRLSIYEINTAVWLGGHSLADVPARRWDAIAALPVDAVWLMGVWQRSPAGLAIAAADEGLSSSFRRAVADLRPTDVIGSPYCVRDYVVDERFGGREALAVARRELAARGLRLILDYVPNHVAPDHPWLASHPEYFIQGTEEELAERPGDFVRTAGGIVARGRDPYFPPWPDVVQLDAFSDGLRSAVAETLVDVGAQCDGLRCDMAMLMTNEVFARTWGVPAPRRGVLAGADRAREVDAPRAAVHRRGVLGHGVGAPAAGVRLLLRQAALRPAGGAGRSCAGISRRRSTTRSGWSASSRTTTSRVPPPCSGPSRRAPPRS